MAISPELVEIANKINDDQLSRISAQNAGKAYVPFDVNVAMDICSQIQDGGILTKILSKPGYPTPTNFFEWLKKSKKLFDLYQSSKQIRTEIMSEQLQDVHNGKDVNKARLEFDVTKWLLSKQKPGTYGDKIDITTGGEPIKVMISHGYRLEGDQIVAASDSPGSAPEIEDKGSE
jgi:hypothetical protein